MRYGYIYKLELKKDLENFKKGEIYIGKHNGIKQNYLGSGKLIKYITKKYSKDSFNLEILAKNINNDELLSYLERYYIDFYKSNRSIYNQNLNLTNGGEGICGYKHSEEHCKKISERIKKEYLENKRVSPKLKKVYQYCIITGKQLNVFDNCTKASLEVNCNPSSIASCARGEINSVKGYSWNYQNLEYYRPSIFNKKKILQYDLNNNFIKEWDSATDVKKELGYNNSSITNCCKKISKTSYGYIWKYKES